jgi:hypothetical protein
MDTALQAKATYKHTLRIFQYQYNLIHFDSMTFNLMVVRKLFLNPGYKKLQIT